MTMWQAEGKWVEEQGCQSPFKNTRGGGAREMKDKSVMFCL